MGSNKKQELTQLYEQVKKRYLKLKSNSKLMRRQPPKNDTSIIQSTQPISKSNHHIAITAKSKMSLDSKGQMRNSSSQYLEGDKQRVQQSMKDYSDEYSKSYIGKEKQFYYKYKHDLTAIMFLKYALFSHLNNIDSAQNVQQSSYPQSSLSLLHFSQRSYRQSIASILNLLHKSAVWIFILLAFVMFGLNIFCHFQEIMMEKHVLETYREKYLDESEALYQLQRQKHLLFEKVRRHKDLNLLQSILNRQIKLNLSFIFGILFLLAGFLKSVLFPYPRKQNFNKKTVKSPLFQDLAFSYNQRFTQTNQGTKNLGFQNEILQNNQNENNNNNPKTITEVYDEHARVSEERFLSMFNEQKDYILRRKEEEGIKRDILEQKKQEMLNQLKYFNYQNEKTIDIKKQRRQRALNFNSFSQENRQENPLKFVSDYYNYEKMHSSEDEDYDLPSFGQMNKNPLMNKFKKRSQLIVREKEQEQYNEPAHMRSKSIGSAFNIINTKNESESYKFCERPF